MVAIPELPADARFVRALLQSEELLQQQVDFPGNPRDFQQFLNENHPLVKLKLAVS